MKLPKRGPSLATLFSETANTRPELVVRPAQDPNLRQLIERANNEGWNWEDCAYRAKLVDLTDRELWFLIKLSRLPDHRETPLKDQHRKPFSYRLPGEAHRILHLMDLHLGGTIASLSPQITSRDEHERYLITSLFEEAITSSQLEGAAVTREVAKTMLLQQRPPRTVDEQMVLNNYHTITMLKDLRQEKLSPELLCRIQQRLTQGTDLREEAQGRFRSPEENVTVWDDEETEPLHVPPTASKLPQRMEQLCDFANQLDAGAVQGFVHPAVRAIILHFWIGYDHPFVDGNGRTARALFYWQMLRSGYWLVEYLSISAIIRKQPKQYVRAYLHTETDDNDLTYFILYHLRVVERSIEEFRSYVRKKLRERQQLEQTVLPGLLTERQRAIILKALKDPATVFTYQTHASSHGITLATARSDLLDLEAKKLLQGNRHGRRFEFIAIPDLDQKLKQLSHRQGTRLFLQKPSSK